MANEMVTINGVTYEVTKSIDRSTADPAMRSMMEDHGKSRFLFLRRPNGRGIVYHVAEYAASNGARVYSKVVSMGAWS